VDNYDHGFPSRASFRLSEQSRTATSELDQVKKGVIFAPQKE
jgi:hypothetical protein